MFDRLFDRLVPVAFAPGHMGTFLQCFLTPKMDNFFGEIIRKSENHEWHYNDLFDGFFGEKSKTFNELIQILSKDYLTSDVFKVACIVILNTKMHLKNIGSLDLQTKRNIPILLEFAKDKNNHQLHIPIELIESNTSRYIKEHYATREFNAFSSVSTLDIKWKNKKINCVFPDSKLWITYYLLKYKSNQSANLKVNVKELDCELDDIFKNRSNLHFDTSHPHIEFNIYNLVFNKNLDQVYEIDPNFEFTIEKKTMLDLANKSSLAILSHYGLDHNFNINDNTTVSEVLRLSNSKP